MPRPVPFSLDRRQWMLAVVGASTTLVDTARGRPWAGQWRIGCWHVHTSFPVRTEPPSFVAVLQALEREVRGQLGLEASPAPIGVIILGDRREYDRYLRTYFPKAPRRPALFLQGTGPGIILTYRREGLAADLRHEATHGILHQQLPFVPLWLDEGLAEYFELPVPAKLKDHPHVPPLRRELDRGQVPSLPRLESLTQLTQMDGDDYRGAWSWVYLLLHASPSSRQALVGYLHNWKRGERPEPLSRFLSRSGSLETTFRRFWQPRLRQVDS